VNEPRTSTDWHDTRNNAKQVGYQVLSAMEGVYIKALSDKDLVKKWRAAR
jgi:hypothetical protein